MARAKRNRAGSVIYIHWENKQWTLVNGVPEDNIIVPEGWKKLTGTGANIFSLVHRENLHFVRYEDALFEVVAD